MKLSSGIDMKEIDRIERAISRHGDRFYRRFFTEQEVSFCQGRPARLAGRFAVKEAVAKALGTGIGEFNWIDIEIVSDGLGKSAQGLIQWSISISHTDTHAVGMAVAIGE
jgi:holo-[acyl-carrier protein] synthase